MKHYCVFADLTSQHDAESSWLQHAQRLDFALQPKFCTSETLALGCLRSMPVAMLVIFIDKEEVALQSLLHCFQDNIGSLPDFQAIVTTTETPSPQLLAQCYEYEIEQIFGRQEWADQITAISHKVLTTLADPQAAESMILDLTAKIRAADQGKIREAQQNIKELTEYDYRAAFANGRACEAIGDLAGAIHSFDSATHLNVRHRASFVNLGSVLIINGQADRAIKILEKLEQTNPSDIYRKSELASAYLVRGDLVKARDLLKSCQKIAADHPKVREAEAQVLLAEGKIDQSLSLLDRLSEVGPLFASSLNDLGVRLSRAGKGQSALALYRKAHAVVRPDLRYKISLNAALACRRMGDLAEAKRYLDRCEQEYGGSFDKLDKIRAAVADDASQLGKLDAG